MKTTIGQELGEFRQSLKSEMIDKLKQALLKQQRRDDLFCEELQSIQFNKVINLRNQPYS